MKIYVVTDGSYSDYTIEKVFSNRPAAEEFKKWRRIQNDIEEWEVYDEPFGTQDGEKVMFIRVQGTVYPEAVVDIRYDIRPELLRDWELSKGAGIHSVSKPGVFNIHCYRHVPADKWDEEKYKDLLTKVLYDYAGIVKAMLAEGASIRDVEMAISQREGDCYMISAAEARQFKEHVWQYQLEQIDRAVKETIIAGGHECGYRADLLDERTIEQLRLLGYKVEVADYHFTKISWEE